VNHTYLNISFIDDELCIQSNPEEGNAILSMRILKLLDGGNSFCLKVVDVIERID
jgi:hypothetical protein